MPVPASVKEEVSKLVKNNNMEGIFSYFKKMLAEKNVTPANLLEYISQEKNKNIISPEKINLLGVCVKKQVDVNDEEKNYCVKFYALSAERGCDAGSNNYAMSLLGGRYGLEKSPADAIKYARKTVDLSKNNSIAKQQVYKHSLFLALKGNEDWVEAISVLIEYLQFHLPVNTTEDFAKKLAGGIQFLNTRIKALEAELEVENEDIILQLQPIIDCNITTNEFLSLKQQAYFLKGQYHETVDENSAAWIAYCAVNDEDLPCYSEAITARKELLKKHVNSLVTECEESSDETDNEDKDELMVDVSISPNIQLSENVKFPIMFGTSWTLESKWFHSVAEDSINEEYEKRSSQIQELIKTIELEVGFVEEALKINRNEPGLIRKKGSLKNQLKTLKTVRDDYWQAHEDHLPEVRASIRRHQTESNFFKPDRSNKIANIIALVEKIIDHRFNIENATSVPIDLAGISARIFISAERLFQESVVALSGSNYPLLGIPTARKKSWNFSGRSGYTEYGPVESYQVDKTKVRSEHRADPKRQRLGDSFLPDLKEYDTLCRFLIRLIDDKPDNEKILADFMIQYGQKHKTITVGELQSLYAEADQTHVDYFNQICFLIMEKEQSQWHSATEIHFQLGMSVAQARSLILIKEGKLTFREVFTNNAIFGVYSQTGILNDVSKVALSCKYIDALYMQHLQSEKSEDHIKFFKKHIKNHLGRPTAVLTREQAHLDMKQVYGGDSDTDGEGYDTDLSSPRPNTEKVLRNF